MRAKVSLPESSERNRMSEPAEATKCLAFKAGDRYLGLEARYIYRIVEEVTVTPVPRVPDWYLGLMYYRGEVFDVVHAGSLLGNRQTSAVQGARVIVLKWSNRKLAVVPDRIVGMRPLEDQGTEKVSCTNYDHPMRVLTPEELWGRVSGISDVPQKL